MVVWATLAPSAVPSARAQGGCPAERAGTPGTTVAASVGESVAPARFVERAELVMGTVARIAGDDPALGSLAFEAAFAALRDVDAGMSLYRADSELVRVNARAAGHAEPVGSELFTLLARARQLSEETDGAFDVTVLPLLRLWGAYGGLSYLGAGRVGAVGFAGLQLDPSAHTVSFRRPGMGLDLGGIAKGFALDRARAALVAAGVRRARLDLGGTLVLLGDDGDWRVAVRDPRAPETALGVLVLSPDTAVSTSANYARDFAREGWRAPSHIYDPRSGRPVRAGRAVTVWAADATTADALSTALLVLGPDGADAVLARERTAGALFFEQDQGGRVTMRGRPPRDWRTAEPASASVPASVGACRTREDT